MGALMHDAYGIGLAATQVGVMHRLLVYRTELEGAVAALVNPVLEWSSKDKEIRRGGLPLAARRRGRGRAARPRAGDARRTSAAQPILVEASGLEARVIQHEMDHLDGVLILDKTSRDQRKQAMRALREALESPARRLACAPSISAPRSSRPSCSAGWRPPTTTSRWSSRGRTPSRAAGSSLSPPPVARARRRSWGSTYIQPEQLHAPETLQRIADARPDVLTTCAYGVLIKEPLLSDYEMLNVHPSLLPRWRGAAPIERAMMAGDAETGVSIMRVTAGWDSGPVYLQRERADPRRRRLRHARRRGWRRSAPSLLVQALDEHPAPVSRTSRSSPTRTRSARAIARWTSRSRRRRSSARSARCARTSARGCALPDGSFLGVIAAAASTGRPALPPAGWCAPRASGCCSTATAARWS